MSATASSSYIALLNAFFLSLVALLPQTNLGPAALVLSLLGLAHHIRSAWRFARHRESGVMAGALSAAFILIGVLLYGSELQSGIHLVHSPNASAPVSSLAGVLVGIYGFGLASAWLLLRGRIQGLSGRLYTLPENEGSHAETRMDRPHASSGKRDNGTR